MRSGGSASAHVGRKAPITQSLEENAIIDVARPILVVHAGAGDEALYTGGTLALLTAAGSSPTVLTCASDRSDDAAPLEALRVLGVTDHRVLGAPGARIAGSPPRRYAVSASAGAPAPDALVAADPAEIAADIATVIATTGAEVVIGPPENEGRDDPDRRATSRAARRAAEVMDVAYYPVVTDPWVDAEEIDVASVIERKADAIRAYRGRFTVDGDTVVLADGSRMPLTAVERFGTGERHPRRTNEWSTNERSANEWSAPDWSELGVGGRITTLVAALLLGAVVGALGTIAFQSTLAVFGQVLPAGLIASLLIVTGVLAGLRLVTGTRFVAAAAAVGTLGVIAVLSQESPGGSILIPALPLSYYWVYGPAVIAFLVLAWPDLHRHRRPAGREGRVRITEASNRKEHPQQ